QRRCWSAANRAIASGVLSSIPVVSLPPTGAAKACERAPTSNATRPYSMFVLLLDAGRMLPGSPTPHMSRHTLVTRAQGPVTLSVLANGAGSRSTDEVRPEPASGSARLPRENPTTRPPGQAGITYKERGEANLLEVVVHHRTRRREEMPLHIVHARREQDRHAGRVLHVFGDGTDAQFARAPGDVADLGLVVLVARQVFDEAAVDLEHVRLEVGQQLERVQADAELLQCQARVEAPDLVRERLGRIEVGEDLGLGQLQHQVLARHAVRLQLLADERGQVVVLER